MIGLAYSAFIRDVRGTPGWIPEQKGSERRITGDRGKRPVVRNLAAVVVLASLSAACASNTTSNKDEGSGNTAEAAGSAVSKTAPGSQGSGKIPNLSFPPTYLLHRTTSA